MKIDIKKFSRKKYRYRLQDVFIAHSPYAYDTFNKELSQPISVFIQYPPHRRVLKYYHTGQLLLMPKLYYCVNLIKINKILYFTSLNCGIQNKDDKELLNNIKDSINFGICMGPIIEQISTYKNDKSIKNYCEYIIGQFLQSTFHETSFHAGYYSINKQNMGFVLSNNVMSDDDTVRYL